MSTRLEIALRKNIGKKHKDSFISELAQYLDQPKNTIELLELIETDNFFQIFEDTRKQYKEGYLKGFSKSWVDDDKIKLDQFLYHLQEVLGNSSIVLLRSLSRYCGAVRSTRYTIFKRAFYLVSLDQDDLIALDDNKQGGIMLTYDKEYIPLTGGVQQYNLFIWGDEWMKAIQT